MRFIAAPTLRVLPLLAALAATPVWAEPVSADVAQLLQSMQARLTRLETRNAELERRLADSAPANKEASLKARVEDLENEVVALSKKPDPMARFEGLSAGASLVMVAQGANGVDTELTARADVEVELPMGSIGDAEGKLFAHFRAGNGDGIDAAGLTWAPTNSMAFGQAPQVDLMQAWYQLDVPVGGASGDLGRVEFTVGKIDPFGFFDGNNISDDESEQFLNLAFIHNPLLDAGGDVAPGDDGASPGVRVAYVSDVNGGNNLSLSVGYFGAGDDGATVNGGNFSDSFDSGLVIGQVEYAGKTFAGLSGAYRLYGWSNGNAFDLAGLQDHHSGWGVSLDQEVGSNVTLSSRIGFSTEGQVNFDRAFTLGAQVAGAGWGRENDRIGLAYGWLDASKASGMSDAEQMFELYYAWQLNDQIALTPDIQWIKNPGGDSAADDITVWGLRAKASF